ncbi:MAG: ABC transporter ATP-binding protein [Pseudomonadota bacterium]
MNIIDRAHDKGGAARPPTDPVQVLQVRDLRVGYADKTILNGLDLSIHCGEIFGLLGPNGSGKTTLIRAICGRIRPKSGEIRIAGVPNTRRGAFRNIGLVPQEIALYSHLTVKENLIAFGRLSGLSRRACRRSTEFAIEATHLAAHAETAVHALSGGWKRRANIAAALLHKPSLLILDEPTVGVDVDARNALQDLIRSLGKSGLAVLLTTHDLDQAQMLCRTVGFLRQGVINPCGRPADLLEKEYPGQRLLIVDLYQRASQETRGMLKRLGFVEQRSGFEWSRTIKTSSQDQAGLVRALRQTDLKVKEIRFREPGLDTLFVRLTGQELQP